MGYEKRSGWSKDDGVNVQPDVLDARGRALQEGDEVVLNIPGHVYFRVAGIVPNLDPNLPKHLMTVHIAVVVSFAAKAGEINREFIRVRTLEEAGPLPYQMTSQGELPTKGDA